MHYSPSTLCPIFTAVTFLAVILHQSHRHASNPTSISYINHPVLLVPRYHNSPISSLLSPFLSSRDFGSGPTFLEPSPESSVDRRKKWQDHYFQDWSSADLHRRTDSSCNNEAFLSPQRKGRKTPSPQNHLYYQRSITFHHPTPVLPVTISLPSVGSILAHQSSIPTNLRWGSTAPDNSSLIIIKIVIPYLHLLKLFCGSFFKSWL